MKIRTYSRQLKGKHCYKCTHTHIHQNFYTPTHAQASLDVGDPTGD